MPDDLIPLGSRLSTPPTRPACKHVRANSESESTDSLVVTSVPIFVLEENDVSTDEDEVSGSEEAMSGSARMEVEDWIEAGEESDDLEKSPRASESDETVHFESPSRQKNLMDDDETPRAMEKWKVLNTDNDILADPFAGEDCSKSGYKPLPGLFGEMIHYGEGRWLVKGEESSRPVVFPTSVHQDTDMTGVSVTYPESDIQHDTHQENDTPMYHNVDDKWMENLLSLPWVSKDMSMIFDTESKKLVPMPRRRLARKKLVIDLYTILLKGVLFIQLDAFGDWMKETVPTELWWDVFTEKENQDLQKATYKKLRFDLITHAITIVEEWRLRYGFPKVPESAQEVLDAKGETKMRHEMKSELLTKASGKSVDRWVKYVFQGVVEAETMDRVLNSDLEGIRQRVISKLVHVTELPFSESWTVCALCFGSLQSDADCDRGAQHLLGLWLMCSRSRDVSRRHFIIVGRWRTSLKSS